MNKIVKLVTLGLVLSVFGDFALQADAKFWLPKLMCQRRIQDCIEKDTEAKAKEMVGDWCAVYNMTQSESKMCLTEDPKDQACTSQEAKDMMKRACDSKMPLEKCNKPAEACFNFTSSTPISKEKRAMLCRSLSFGKKITDCPDLDLSKVCTTADVEYFQFKTCGLTGWLPGSKCVMKMETCVQKDKETIALAMKNDRCGLLNFKGKDETTAKMCLTASDGCTEGEYMDLRHQAGCDGASAVVLSAAALLMCLVVHLFGK